MDMDNGIKLSDKDFEKLLDILDKEAEINRYMVNALKEYKEKCCNPDSDVYNGNCEGSDQSITVKE